VVPRESKQSVSAPWSVRVASRSVEFLRGSISCLLGNLNLCHGGVWMENGGTSIVACWGNQQLGKISLKPEQDDRYIIM
jgi:hypothetical protein